MNRVNMKLIPILTTIFLLLMACGASVDTTPTVHPPVTLTSVVVVTNVPPSTEAVIPHTLIPVNLPANRSDHAGDYVSSETAEEKRSNGGDRFTFERFERPFNSNTMEVYFPELDIVDTLVYQDETWIYGVLQVVDRSAAVSSPYRFAMQLDNDVDGKGDYLVLASNPASSDWTTDSVQVFFDANSDVGDLTAMFTDEGSTSDGFETLIFDQGNGDDPDAAWIRVSPQNANAVEFAVKRSVFGNPSTYMVDMWTGHASLDASKFDYSDHFTHEQAGAADSGLPIFYPIKAVYELDNTCRMAVGFQPTGYEPGVCEQPVALQSNPGTSPSGHFSCTGTSAQILACALNQGTWNSSTCTCIPSAPEPTPEPPR